MAVLRKPIASSNPYRIPHDTSTLYQRKLLFSLLGSLVLVLLLSKEIFRGAPTTSPSFKSLVNDDGCSPSCTNCSKLKYFESKKNFDIRDLYSIELLNNTIGSTPDAAVCVWNGTHLNTHLPHWLEIVYRCWSWWDMQHLKQNVLEVPNGALELWNRSRSSPFAEGLWNVISRAKRIEVRVGGNNTASQIRATPSPNKIDWSFDDELYLPWFSSVKTARTLRKLVVKKTFPGRRLSGCVQHDEPRIGVLDRLETRHLLNHRDIVKGMQSLVSTPVRYTLFETATFSDQIDFFSSVDILVSPHGAQLSGAAFLPTCGQVLELLPRYYHCQFFFGTLTTSAGSTASYLYLSDENAQLEMKNITTHESRRLARSVQLCPPIPPIVSAVKELIQKWMTCCRK